MAAAGAGQGRRAKGAKAAQAEAPVSFALFAEGGPQAREASPFYRVVPRPKSAAPSFPVLLMSQGFDRNAAKAEAMLTLRLTVNQGAKGLPAAKAAFMEALRREIALKRGDYEADMMMRDALMERFLGKRA